MKSISIILSINLVLAFSTFGQSKSNGLTFYQSEEGYVLGQYASSTKSKKDYFFQISDNDSARLICFESFSKDKHQTISREEFTGTYKRHNDTLYVSFDYSIFSTKNRFGLIDSSYHIISSDEIFHLCKVVITPSTATLKDEYWTLVMILSSSELANEFEKKFDFWDKRSRARVRTERS